MDGVPLTYDGWTRCACGTLLLAENEPRWVCNGTIHAREMCEPSLTSVSGLRGESK